MTREFTPAQTLTPDSLETLPRFSIVSDGPFHCFLRWLHLEQEQAGSVNRLALFVLPMLLWMPLLVLSIASGKAVPGTAALPFFADFEVHTRFLLALPLLLIAEILSEQRMRPLLDHFMQRNLVPPDAMQTFRKAVASLAFWRKSSIPEVLLLALVYSIGILFIWRRFIAIESGTWYWTADTEGSGLSWAGLWYAYVSLPIFQFVLCRWYFRLFLWALFLWRVSKIKLNLLPAHPDRMGGLGFMVSAVGGIVVFAAAHGTLLAGHLLTRIVSLKASLIEYRMEVVAMVILVLVITLGPLMVLAPQMRRARRLGLEQYGELATDYVAQFNAKWLHGNGKWEDFIGSADIQSLADLGNIYAVVSTMRTVPIAKELIGQIVFATLLPIAPLLLTAMPVDQILKRMVGILF